MKLTTILKKIIKKIIFYPQLKEHKKKKKIEIYFDKKRRVSGYHRYSVVSACYNVDKYLEEYFESIVNQTLKFEEHIDLIMVDDGSTDKSAKIIKKWQNKFPENITYIKQENAGPSSARNKGLEYVQTPWVTFIDADDMVNSVYFEEVDKCIVKNKNIDIVSCNQIFYIDETKEYKKHYLSYRFKTGMKVVNPTNMQGYIQSTINSVFFNHQLLLDTESYFHEEVKPVFEDGHFINKLLIKSDNINIAFLNKPKYYYRKRLDNSSIVNTAWQTPDRYTDAIEFGLLDLFLKAKEKYDYIPVYLQRFILYQIHFYYKRIVNDKDKLGFLTQEEIQKFKSLLIELFSYIDPQVIEVCGLGGLWHKYRIGFYNLYKEQILFKQVCYIDGYDKLKKELKVHYYYHSDTKEIFLLNGKKLQPRTEEVREHNFLGEVFVYEKIIYLPLVGLWEYLDIKLGDVETQISLNKKRYKTGIQINNLINMSI